MATGGKLGVGMMAAVAALFEEVMAAIMSRDDIHRKIFHRKVVDTMGIIGHKGIFQ